MSELGRRRRDAGYTQEKLAQAVQVTTRALQSYESGTRRPSPAVAERIARALGMDVATMWKVLYSGKEEGK